jgi:tRNA1Val (adenine37-N6)-methyltransferase
MDSPPFRFKRFDVDQTSVAHPLGTDSVLIGAWTETRDAGNILDIGTGSGVVALMLAQKTEQQRDCQIVGIDSHGPSAACAQRNFEASPWASRLRAVHASAQDFVSAPDFDLIVSNPPFFSDLVQSPDTARRAARSAVTLTHPELIGLVLRALKPDGRFCVVLPYREGLRFCELAAVRGLYFTQKTTVQTQPGKLPERLLLQFEKQPFDIRQDTLPIYERGGAYSEAFRALTGAYYVKDL